MAEQLSTPRITAPYLDNFVNRHVLLIGKVTQLRGDQATLDSDGTVTVLLNRDAHLANGNAVQVIGKVNPDLSIKVLSSKDLGPDVGHGDKVPAYKTRVAMVWSQPDAQSHSPELPLQGGRHTRRSSTSSTLSAATADFPQTQYSDKTAFNSNAPSPGPNASLPPPSGAASDTTYTQPPRSYISATPHSLQGQDELIPSAQPSTPTFPPAPGLGWAFSISDEPSPLPSPPESAPDVPSSPTLSGRSSDRAFVARRGRSPTLEKLLDLDQEDSSPVFRKPKQTSSSRGRHGSSAEPPIPPSPIQNDPMDMPTILEGIGRMHIAMNQDAAGRWRIKRHEDHFE